MDSDPSIMSDIYKRPEEYDLEHHGDDEDTSFYLALARDLRPRRILELGCGTGRITLPLARQGVRDGFAVVGLDNQPEMLRRAVQSRDQADPDTRRGLSYVKADMLTWRSDSPFDLILIPCGSLSHVLELEAQIRLFRRCYDNLAPGGRFVAEVNMPNMAAYMDSFHIPPRAPIEIDLDTKNETEGTRLIRRKTTSYSSDNQLAEIRFLYEKYKDGSAVKSYIDDFASHVFFPRELALLFIHTGFTIEGTLGDYHGRDLNAQSPLIITIGKKMSSPNGSSA
jgi:SAM-dependent methyltransferase